MTSHADTQSDSPASAVDSEAFSSSTPGRPVFCPIPRRPVVRAVLLGLVAASAVAGAAVLLSGTRTYTAQAMLRVAAQQGHVLFPTDDNAEVDFPTYKNTQVQFLKSRFVLGKAVGDEGVADLPAIRQEKDAVGWLSERLQISFPGDGEIMLVSLTHEKPETAQKVVNAVVDAYIEHVVERERVQRLARLNRLDDLASQEQREYRQQRERLQVLADRLGSGDSATLSLKQQFAIQKYTELRRELWGVREKLAAAKRVLNAKKKTLKQPDALIISPSEFQVYARQDPAYEKLLGEMRSLQVETGSVAAGHSENALAQVKGRFARLEDALREELRNLKSKELEAEIARSSIDIELLAEQEKDVQRQVDKALDDFAETGKQSIDVEIMQSDIARLEEVVNTIEDQRQRLRIDLDSEPRIVLVEAANLPEKPDPFPGLPVALAASLGSFVVIAAGVLLVSRPARQTAAAVALEFIMRHPDGPKSEQYGCRRQEIRRKGDCWHVLLKIETWAEDDSHERFWTAIVRRDTIRRVWHLESLESWNAGQQDVQTQSERQQTA